jgi:hypothetical protein
MNVVMIIPTGIGCEIGGHAGDGSPAAKLLASCCDKLIIHPNVVNASDINEQTNNMLYVEGSTLDRFLRGEIYLKEVFYNKILLVVNKPIDNDTINAVNAARATIGADIQIVELETPLEMTGFYKNDKADGKVTGYLELVDQIKNYDFDALAIQTNIKVERETKLQYLRNGGVNPWGGIEAITSKLISEKLDKPVAHAPYVNWIGQDDLSDFNEVVDPRMSAEMVSICYLHCVLKGLHKAPRINYDRGLSVDDIDFLITPISCVGEPHFACMEAEIPIIAVSENKTVLKDMMPDSFIIVDNYIEAAGLLMAYKAGINPHSVRRPISSTKINNDER